MIKILSTAAVTLLLCGPAMAQDVPAQSVPAPDPNAQAVPAPIPQSADTMQPATGNMPEDPNAPEGTQANPTVIGGNAESPPAPKDFYPLCSKTLKDSCMNPSEAPKGYGRSG